MVRKAGRESLFMLSRRYLIFLLCVSVCFCGYFLIFFISCFS